MAEGSIYNVSVEELLVGMVEHNVPNMDGHSIHVHRLCLLLYEHAPWELKRDVNRANLEAASILFNIGRLDILGRVSTTKGQFTETDREMMKNAPGYSEQLVNLMPGDGRVARIVKSQHEWVDGSGHYGMRGDEIPAESKILSICDSYAALVSDRSYRPAKSYEEAVGEIGRYAGTRYDEGMLGAFRGIPRDLVEECDEACRVIMKNFNVVHQGAQGKAGGGAA